MKILQIQLSNDCDDDDVTFVYEQASKAAKRVDPQAKVLVGHLEAVRY